MRVSIFCVLVSLHFTERQVSQSASAEYQKKRKNVEEEEERREGRTGERGRSIVKRQRERERRNVEKSLRHDGILST